MKASALGRNAPCPCGSGRKYKQCCADKDRSLGLQNDFVESHVRRGMALEARGSIDGAIEAYRVAVAIGPAPEAHSRLGHIFLDRGLIGQAIAAFRAASSGGERPERRLDLARALMLEGRAGEAAAQVRSVIDREPRNGDAHWLLGRILSETGRFGEARAALERAAALSPDDGAIYYDLVRTFALGEQDRPLLERMLKAAAAASPPDRQVRLQLALGKAYEDLEDFQSAMRHFEAANRTKKRLGGFDGKAVERRVDGLMKRFTPDFVAAHAGRGNETRLPIFIVGMPRSGTTLVEQILSSHPAIAGGGEMQFWAERGPAFDKANDEASIAGFQRRAAADYLAALRAVAPDARRVTDKNPFNFFWAGAIHLTLPGALLIHCRRDPIDVCLSIFSTYFRPRADFSTDRRDLVLYSRQHRRLMAHWRGLLPKDHLVEVDYEKLVANPEEESRRLIAACGLEWNEDCLRPQDNTRVVRSASKWQARQPVHSGAVGRRKRYEPWIGPLRELEADGMG